MIEIQPGLVYLTRADWGAHTDIPRLGHLVNRLDRTEAIMHHTVIIDNDATPNRWETLAEVKAKMVQLQTIRPDLGLDVPYNFVAFHMADGSLIVCEGRGLDRTGAHTHGHNTRGIATAGEGNFQIGQPVDAYADHWSCWWGWLKHDEGMESLGYSRPTRGIAFGHRDFISTGCPGDNLYTIIPQLIFKEVQDDMGMTPEQQAQFDALKVEVGELRRFQVAHTQFVRDKNTSAAFFIKDGKHHLINAEAWAATELDDAQVLGLTHDEVIALAPERGDPLTLAEASLFANPHRSGAGSGSGLQRGDKVTLL